KPSFKQAMLKNESAKHWTVEDRYIGGVLLQNVLYSFSPSQGVVQGTTNSTRIGDKIHLAALKLKGQILSQATSGAYSGRVIVGFSGNEVPAGAATLASTATGLTYGQVFLPLTGYTSWSTAIVNPKAFTVLYDQTFDINSQITGTQDVLSFSETIPINQDFNYESAGAVYGKFKNLYIIMVSDVAGGATAFTSACSMYISADLIFKEL
uniref:hypothetical protein n=1 Tax=Mariniflexile sp. TaxID=1979402 RepID=UPI0040484130